MLCLVALVAPLGEQPQPVSAESVCPVEVRHEAAALAAARRCGAQVRVGDATTEMATTWANPDGSLSTQMDSGPVRFRRDGAWVDLDADLQRESDGTVSPQAHPGGLDLFGGDTSATRGEPGDRALVTVDASRGEGTVVPAGGADSSISLNWKGGLPQPVLDGDSATYPDAKPGTDVIVQLTATGFRQHTVVKTRPSAPVSFTMPVKLDGLTARRAAGGAVEFLDTDGAVTGVMAAPSMWDSRLDPVSQLPAHSVPVAYTLTTTAYGVDVTLTPDMAFLSDPAVQYPVTIDPDINIKSTFDTYVRKNTTTDQSASTDLAIGVDSTGNPARAFLNWDPAAIRGKHILEAHLGLWNSYSATCADRAIDVYSAGLATVATRWEYSGSGTTGQPSRAATKSGSTSGSKGQASCAAGYISTAAHALDALVQSWANTTSGQQGMALVAPSETDVKYFKRVASGDGTSRRPYLYITYTTIPPVAGCQDGVDGDFNGDGVRDTAIADPQASVNGARDAGAVNIIDGATGAVTTLRQGAGGIPDSPEAGDRFGAALAVYDTNLDGCADLAIGAPFEDSAAIRDSGSVHIVYGAPGGLGTGRAPVAVEQGKALAEGRGTVPDAPEADDWFGYALSAGLTAIGEPYLIVGAPGEDIGTAQDTGLVHYLRDTLNITLDLTAAGAGAASIDDRTGYAIASSPYHIAVGQPGAKLTADTPFAGSVCLFSHAHYSDPPAAQRCLSQGVDGVGDTAEADDQFGKSLAMVAYRPAGAAAGVADSLLVVGTPGEDVGGLADTGQVQQFLLTATAATPLATHDQTSAGVSGGNEDGDYFGEQVAAVNLDPTAEASPATVLVAVGAPGEDLNDVPDAGQVHVFGGGTAAVTDVPISRTADSLPGASIEQNLIGAWLGATPQHLLVPSPIREQAVYAIPWSALVTGSSTPAKTYRPGTGGLPSGAIAFGAAVA